MQSQQPSEVAPARRRRIAAAAVVAGLAATVAFADSSSPSVPIPSPVVKVHTVSGAVSKTTTLLAQVPAEIDVDNDGSKDVVVSVGVIDVSQLRRLVVPNITISRPSSLLVDHRDPPPLTIGVEVEVRDLAAGGRRMAAVSYGYETPKGGTIPPRMTASLTGPITGGFVDPLEAEVRTPGYDGPLDLQLEAHTDGFDGTFELPFDPLPQRLRVVHDPREDGLKFRFDQTSPSTDVALDATADLDLHDPDTPEDEHRKLRIDAGIERLPRAVDLLVTRTGERNDVDVDVTPADGLAAPDVEARVVERAPDDTLRTDATLRLSGVPAEIDAGIEMPVGDDGERELRFFEVTAPQGPIGAVEVAARNFEGDGPQLPAFPVGPDHFVAAAARPRDGGGGQDFAARARLERVRGFTLDRTGGEDSVRLTAVIGDGKAPLRVFADLDDRGLPAPPDVTPKRLAIDASVDPLPDDLTTTITTGGDGDATTVGYTSSAPVDVRTRAVVATGEKDACGEELVTCAVARVDRLPAGLDITIPGEKAPDISLDRTGDAVAGGTDVVVGLDQVALVAPPEGGEKQPRRTAADIDLRRIPDHVRGRLETAGDLLKAAEFHACTFDFTQRTCTDEQGALGSVRFRVSDQPGRQGLPERPPTAERHVVLLRDHARFEVTGRVDQVRNAEFRQRPNAKQTAGETLGVLVDAGNRDPFDIVVEDVGEVIDPETGLPAGDASKRAEVRLTSLPSTFSTCLRPQSDAEPVDSDDPLLDDCDRTSAFGQDDLSSTPLSLHYEASDAIDLDARLDSRGPDFSDRDPEGRPRPATLAVDSTVTDLPKVLSLDLLDPPRDAQGGRTGPLRVAYGAEAPASAEVEFDVAAGREDARCRDPRPRREALCLAGRLTDLPASLLATVDPQDDTTTIDVTTQGAGGRRPSLRDVQLGVTSRDPEREPVVLEDGQIVGVPAHLTTVLERAVPFGGGDQEVHEVDFDGCADPGDDAGCEGIGELEIGALRNTLGADPVPAAPDRGESEHLSLVQRGADMRASGRIEKLRRVRLSRLAPNGEPSRTTRLVGAVGSGEPLKLFVDRRGGTSAELIDGELGDAPAGVDVCVRGPLPEGETPAGQDAGFCESADAEHLAFRADLERGEDGGAPDIDLKKLQLERSGAFVGGRAAAFDLSERVDLLARTKGDPDVLLEGRDDEGKLVDAAGRVTFDVRTTRLPILNPRFPLPPSAAITSPADDPANGPAGARNFVDVGRDGAAMRIHGSVPGLRRVRLAPDRCDGDDPRFPAREDFPIAELAPKYTCVQAQVAGGQPLGIAVRSLAPDGRLLALEEGHVGEVPGGEDGLQATLTDEPPQLADAPACSAGGDDPQTPCRPPLLAVTSDRADGEDEPRLEGRLAIGPDELVQELIDEERSARSALAGLVTGDRPRDVLSRRLDYERAPRDYAADGVRLKVGKRGEGVALRLGMRLLLPGQLALDPPAIFSCKRADAESQCGTGPADREANSGRASLDVGVHLEAGAQRGDTSGPPLGRLAFLLRDYDSGKRIVLTGAPPLADPEGQPHTPENLPAPGSLENHGAQIEDLGFVLPRLFDVRFFQRDDFESKLSTDAEGKEFTAPGDAQQHFLQLDGRVSAPLSLALRMDDPEERDGVPSTNQDGQRVAAVSVGAHDLQPVDPERPADPGFRVRVEQRFPAFTSLAEREQALAAKKEECREAGDPDLIRIGGFCLAVGPVANRYLDVALDAAPRANEAPARRVDAVVDLVEPGGAQVDVVGFEGLAPDAAATVLQPQAALRFEPFDLLAGAAGAVLLGAGVVLEVNGDLIAGLDTNGGQANGLRRLRVGLAAPGLLLGAADGRANLKARLDGSARKAFTPKVVVDLPTVISNFEGPFDVRWNDCATGNFLGSNDLSVSFRSLRAVLAPELTEFGLGLFQGLANKKIAETGCPKLETADDDLVADGHPAPRFAEAQHPVPPQNAIAENQSGSSEVPANEEEIVVNESTTLCGSIDAKRFVVRDGVTVRVGRPGETAVSPGSLPQSVPCDGTLDVHADHIEVDGTIDGRAAFPVQGPGTDPAGGGAGHGGRGGRADGTVPQQGGPTYGPDQATTGSSGGERGGAGGGAIGLASEGQLILNGTLDVGGGDGQPGEPGCGGRSGGGGGSGGTIELSSKELKIFGDAEMIATGGRGGEATAPQGFGGGGGGGGRVRIFTIDGPIGDTTTGADVGGGDGGGGDDVCESSTPGQKGVISAVEAERVGNVSLPGGGTQRFSNAPKVGLNLEALQNDRLSAQVFVCSRFASVAVSPAERARLLAPPPLPEADTRDLAVRAWLGDDRHTCVPETFTDAPEPTDIPDLFRYAKTGVAAQLDTADGFQSFYVLPVGVSTDGDPALRCRDPKFQVPGTCIMPRVVPVSEDVVVEIDRTAPTLSVSPVGDADCAAADQLICVNRGTAAVDIDAADAGTGLASVSCSRPAGSGGGAIPTQNCENGPNAIALGGSDGIKEMVVTARDRAGNTADLDSLPRLAGFGIERDFPAWAVDRRAPGVTSIELDYLGAPQRNGFFTSKPRLTITGGEAPGFSTGMSRKVEVLVDGEPKECTGTRSDQGRTVACILEPDSDLIPDSGTHTFAARVRDQAGNVSALSIERVMKVDRTRPASRLVLDPAKPDGVDPTQPDAVPTVYRTAPAFGFAASDGLDGSGVDFDVPGSGVEFRLDDAALRAFDPDDPDGNVVPEGRHRICFRATDVAGNVEAVLRCSPEIRVDSTPPVVEIALSPDTPDGDNGFHDTRPKASITAHDAGIEPTGVAVLETRLDDGAWTAATEIEIPEGTHTVAARAVDHAGNATRVVEREVRVDTVAPVARAVSFPPAPNARGVFRRARVLGVTAFDGDGSGVDRAVFGLGDGVEEPLAGEVTSDEPGPAFRTRAIDRAGHASGFAISAGPIDRTPPTAAVRDPAPAPITLLSPSTTLRFDAGDARGQVRVRVQVREALLHSVVRTLNAGGDDDGFRAPGSGSVVWDGRADDGLNALPGEYYYRVQVVDEAGNTAASGESATFSVVQLPLG